MNLTEYHGRATEILRTLVSNPDIGTYVDATLTPPKPYGPLENAQLIFIGQDPTVKRVESRAGVKVVLNLERRGPLRNYLSEVCGYLGVDLDRDVAALNIANNFFVAPPASLPDQVLAIAVKIWTSLVRDQLDAHPTAQVICLGQPMLKTIVNSNICCRVRDYWGDVDPKTPGMPEQFRFISRHDNRLERNIFPFPHQPSRRRIFYNKTFKPYCKFVSTFRSAA